MKALAALFSASLAVIFAMPISIATAQPFPRTFVSGTGNDLLTCTRASPCLTFQAALAQTAAGGEINCLDAGNFGSVTISQSVTIDCGGTLGGINPVAGDVGVFVNTPGVIVRLRNLTINGMAAGTIGVRFDAGAALFVENCVIANFNGGPVFNGIGIRFAPPAGATGELYVLDSIITTNGRTADGGGIVIQPVGSGSARVAIERTRVENNTYGIFANGTGSTGVIAVQIRDSVSGANTFEGVSAFTAAGQSTTSITLERSSSVLNGTNGVLSQGSPAFVLLGESTVMSNGTGLSIVSGGNILSYQDNQLTGNGSDGVTPAPLMLR